PTSTPITAPTDFSNDDQVTEASGEETTTAAATEASSKRLPPLL
ncbi:hypothetical protein EI008_26540, partial [Escherichia coli]|nr:hypothetical protein [Escherichia coli]